MTVRAAARGLSTAELEQIRDALAVGRRPKVVFTQSAGQIAGQQGQVVELTDATVSDEWVVVRFGRDELPFSPADLAIAPRGAAPRRPVKTASPAEAPGPPLLPPEPPPVKPATAVSTPREESTVTRPATSDAQAPVNGKSADAVASPDGTAGDVGAQPARQAKAPARKVVRAKPPATLTVTLSYADGEWMVAAQQGTKALAKPYVIRATEALKMVGMLDVSGVHEAVEEIVSAARAEAEAEAERLRSELAEIEARLAELREAN
ncbi:MAG TPA: hypothetical protein VGP31_17525 [Planosporangium sp.]|jgi:hypothetical protein|nr:hypothetical protein [Planosporangium sp.]